MAREDFIFQRIGLMEYIPWTLCGYLDSNHGFYSKAWRPDIIELS
jgi:hypothetical protein